MAEIETFILLPWQLIYPSNHTQKLLFKSTVTSIPNQTAEIWKYPSVLSSKFFVSRVKDIDMMRIL